MAIDLTELTDHDLSDECPICRAQHIVQIALLPAAAAWEANDEGKALAAIDDAMVEQHAVFGPVEQCRDRIQEYFNAGLDRIIISPRVAEGDSRNPFDVVVNALGPGA